MEPSSSTHLNPDDSSWMDVLFSDDEDTNQTVFGQLEKEFGFPNQGTRGMDQTSPNQLPQAAFTQATTSSGVMNTMLRHPIYFASVQPRTSQPLSISNEGRKMPGTTQNKEKKKETDRKYRNRQKEKDEKTKDGIKELSNENAHLKEENESLIKATSATNESWQSATAEKEKLEKDISLLNRDIKSLQNHFDLYSQRLVNSNHVDHQAELIHLKNKISILRQNSNRNNWRTEKQELVDEIANLERQNKVLKVQVEVLSEMNINKDIEEKSMISEYSI